MSDPIAPIAALCYLLLLIAWGQWNARHRAALFEDSPLILPMKLHVPKGPDRELIKQLMVEATRVEIGGYVTKSRTVAMLEDGRYVQRKLIEGFTMTHVTVVNEVEADRWGAGMRNELELRPGQQSPGQRSK